MIGAINFALIIFFVVLGVRAFFALRRTSTLRREFALSAWLELLVLILPLGPLLLLLGNYVIPQVVAFPLAAALFVATWFVASKQRGVLECAGTDRADAALAAISLASLAALTGGIYVALAGTFSLLFYALQAR